MKVRSLIWKTEQSKLMHRMPLKGIWDMVIGRQACMETGI